MSEARWTPRVSVVVPVWNAERTLDACLRSLLALDYPQDRLEIVAVDNRSTDGTAEILKRYAGRIRTAYEPRRGPAAARNCGIRAGGGEVVAQTDSDCVVDPAWLARIVAPLADPAVGLVGGRILSVRPCNGIETYGEEIHDHEKAIAVYSPPYVITMNWAARRTLLDASGLFDETLLRCEDVDLAYRIVQRGCRIAYAHDAVVYHHNERTWRGLFREGFLHGLYSVQAIRKHAAFLAGYGHRSFSLRSYAAIASAFGDALAGRERERSLCIGVFNSGKKLGKLAGSIRFRHFDA
jgi:glycosyltransferase involved in cell wall biosynthesis